MSAAASSSFLGFADFRCVVGLVVDAVLVEGLARPFRLVRDDRLVLVRLAASSVAAFVEARFVVVVETFAAAAFERATAFDELAFDDAPFAVVVPPFDAPPSDAFPAFDAFFRDRRFLGFSRCVGSRPSFAGFTGYFSAQPVSYAPRRRLSRWPHTCPSRPMALARPASTASSRLGASPVS